jgi:hypothetical protein
VKFRRPSFRIWLLLTGLSTAALLLVAADGGMSVGRSAIGSRIGSGIASRASAGVVAELAAEAAEAAAAAKPSPPYARTEEREPCSDYTPTKRPFFGDLHVHTARSQDASTQDTRTSPRDAYRFAKGQPLPIQPYDENDKALRYVSLDRPLDFAAVTDHAEQIGEVHICNTPNHPQYGAMVCRLYRTFPRVAFFVMNGRYSLFESRWGFCGDDAEICLEAAGVVWKEHQRAAEEAYDRSKSCAFTSFVAYEWTASGHKGGHLHRNVIFRNQIVPALPISVMETSAMAIHLWRGLDKECRDGRDGCESLTIPHNSNWSLGSAFTSAVEPGAEITQEEASIRSRYDRLVEVMQHKGESECAIMPGVTDEGCSFEKAPDPLLPSGADAGIVAVDFARDALKRGLALEKELGTNPFHFGLIGSTDTHLGTPGLVKEEGFPGHGGAGKPGTEALEPGLPDVATLNPGGLAVLWAEENSRDALYASMERKEAYATSGTRPELRFFGGWEFEASTCQSESPAASGYAQGVPMGADLAARPSDQSTPRFLVQASRDPHPNGADLERLEIVKGWVEGGEQKEKVITVAGGPNGSSVDLNTCERRGEGQTQLCTVWEDPDFDASQSAFYYARLRENPSCRWTQYACNEAGVRCDDPATMKEGYEACCSGEVPATIQERAWSSPIWYQPSS